MSSKQKAKFFKYHVEISGNFMWRVSYQPKSFLLFFQSHHYSCLHLVESYIDLFSYHLFVFAGMTVAPYHVLSVRHAVCYTVSLKVELYVLWRSDEISSRPIGSRIGDGVTCCEQSGQYSWKGLADHPSGEITVRNKNEVKRVQHKRNTWWWKITQKGYKWSTPEM